MENLHAHLVDYFREQYYDKRFKDSKYKIGYNVYHTVMIIFF